jgi:ABC-type glycerol-3-phosphate transport system substrate-binding protein
MKKLTAILLTFCVMSVALVGCSNDTTSTSKEKKTTETTTTKTPPKTP